MMLEEKQRILLVDDEPQLVKVIKMRLEGAGYFVLSAGTGQEALKLVKEENPDLIILDIVMPDIDGFQICNILRSQYKTSHIPIIFLSAMRGVEDKIKGFNIGADDFLTKPFVSGELLARVNNILIKNSALKLSSPLTGLPGNVSIRKETARRIANGGQYSWIYFDLDNFKEYNDHYGFLQGDDVIHFISEILVEALEKKGNGNDFLGHIGGDDFIVISTIEKTEDITQYVLQKIEDNSHRFFRDKELRVGYYEYVKRDRQTVKIPTQLCLTVAVITSEDIKFQHPAQVSTFAAQVKEYGKSIKGSVVVYNRRKTSGPL
jgi:diguanylate cyclase (GGDEF)-like protein